VSEDNSWGEDTVELGRPQAQERAEPGKEPRWPRPRRRALRTPIIALTLGGLGVLAGALLAGGGEEPRGVQTEKVVTVERVVVKRIGPSQARRSKRNVGRRAPMKAPAKPEKVKAQGPRHDHVVEAPEVYVPPAPPPEPTPPAAKAKPRGPVPANVEFGL